MNRKNNEFEMESVPGNTLPLAILSFFAMGIAFAFGLLLIFSDINVTSSGLIESPIVNKIIGVIIMLVIACFFLAVGLAYLKKAKKYYREKKAWKNEKVDETVTDEIWQRTCPKCGKSHDIDYPKCPNCKFNYFK